MASGQVLAKFRNSYSKAESEMMRWSKCQERVISLLGTVGNVASRLPALQSPSNYGMLADVPFYPKKLLGKQLLALEGLLQQLQAELREMADAVRALDKFAHDAERSVHQDKRLTPSARAAAAGPVPSVDQCLQGLLEIWSAHSAEQRLQEALVREVRYDSSATDVQELTRAAAARTNLDAQRMRDLVYMVAATADPA